MFVTYSRLAVADNWVHDFICTALTSICRSEDEGRAAPSWSELLDQLGRDPLRHKRTLPKLLQAFALEAANSSHEARDLFLSFLGRQNQIEELLDGSAEIPIVEEGIGPMVVAAQAVFEEGFSLLSKTRLRDDHYKIIWNNLENKTCPFCGLEPFDAPDLRREDEDHYLLRAAYPLAAANLFNLVPMGGKCNKLYKGRIDILRSENGRRRALNPYGSLHLDISLIDSDPFGHDDKPDWRITLLPDTEEARTWEDVFSIRERLTKSVLAPYFDTWLDELPDWFQVRGANDSISDESLMDILDGFTAYKAKHKEIGPGFLKHKVLEMLTHHCRKGNQRLIAMIRASLPRQLNAA